MNFKINNYTYNKKQDIEEKNTRKNKQINSIIPLNIFQTWHSLELPEIMKENVEILKKQNPEFKYNLYDDTMCREFISEHFHEDVLYTFDKLKPGAYKADLWRYCILYINGGIYLDIKFRCTNNFKLIYLTDSEYFVRDRNYQGIHCGVYNGLIISMPYNSILIKTINNIVDNVKNTFYKNIYNNTIDALMVSGPLLLSKQFNINEIKTFALSFSNCGNYINCDNLNILEIYNEYHKEKQIYSNKPYYVPLYKNVLFLIM